MSRLRKAEGAGAPVLSPRAGDHGQGGPAPSPLAARAQTDATLKSLRAIAERAGADAARLTATIAEVERAAQAGQRLGKYGSSLQALQTIAPKLRLAAQLAQSVQVSLGVVKKGAGA